VIDARVPAVSILSSSGVSATISALIWIAISAFTGDPAAFVILGAILCGLVVFVVGYSIRRVAVHR
jgi:VIT1/CCC1 family predicted Fe2+/Mn2+ transporter